LPQAIVIPAGSADLCRKSGAESGERCFRPFRRSK
jgi:hypothetical protein